MAALELCLGGASRAHCTVRPQVPAFVENCSKTATEAECVKHKDVTKWFALIGLILCVGFFVWYLWKQVRHTACTLLCLARVRWCSPLLAYANA